MQRVSAHDMNAEIASKKKTLITYYLGMCLRVKKKLICEFKQIEARSQLTIVCVVLIRFSIDCNYTVV